MADEILDDTADSSPATDPSTDPSGQAPSTPANNGQGSQFVPYARFQQVNTRMHQAEQRAQAVEARIAELEANRAPATPPSTEEQQLKDAREALYRVDPDLKGIKESLQPVLQGHFVTNGNAMVTAFATQHGLDATTLFTPLLKMIQNDPALLQRAKSGDVSIVSQYLQNIEPVVAALKQQGTEAQRNGVANLAQNKRHLSASPPRQAGGPSGPAAPAKLVPGKEREFEANMHTRASDMLKGLLSRSE